MAACGMLCPHALQMVDFMHHIISARGQRDGENIESSSKECVLECANETATAKPVCVCNSM